MRATLGRMSCTASELQAQSGPDAEAIRRIVRLEGARPRAACHLCEGGPGTRAHFRYGCAACKTELGGVAMERSAHLAGMADSLWFSPDRRLPMDSGVAGRRGAGVWRQFHAFEMGKDPTVLTVNTGGLRHGPRERRASPRCGRVGRGSRRSACPPRPSECAPRRPESGVAARYGLWLRSSQSCGGG